MGHLTNRQSTLIKTMRFPLIVLVLYEHSVRTYNAPIRLSLDSANLFHFFTEMISHFLCPIAVAWFFFFSGFLFYHNMQEDEYGWGWATRKWSRRIHSILIPHLFWNLLNVLMVLLVTWIFNRIGIIINSDQMVVVRKGLLFWFITGPIDFPLWYLRNLIILSLLAPAFYYPVKKWPWISLAVILILYIASFKIDFFLFPNFSLFSLGAWMSIRKDNFVVICRRIKYPAAAMAFFLLPVATFFHGSQYEYDTFFRLLFIPSGMITFLNLCDKLYDVDWHRNLMLKLTETVFFIYAAHEIYILGWTKGLFLRIFGQTLAARWISYLFVPVVTLAVCLALFYLLKRIMPRTLSFACGWRTVHSESYSKYKQKYL
jgi:Acyltransferase family.